MDVETVRSKMMLQVDQARTSAMTDVYGWRFEIDELVVYVTLKHRRNAEHIYLLRVTFDDFPRRAPSYVFVDGTTKEMTEEGWPPEVKHSNPPPGICTPGTREFHENIHAKEPQYAWDLQKYTVLSTLQMIHHLMEKGLRN